MHRLVGVVIAGLAAALGVALFVPAQAQAVFNGKIAWTRQGDIFVVDSNGDNKVNLTDTKEFEQQAEFSPDGQTLAFVQTQLEGGFLSDDDAIWLMDADGSNARQVTNFHRQIEGLHWTADGTRLLYFADRDTNPEY